jgi:hypothetical protein
LRLPGDQIVGWIVTKTRRARDNHRGRQRFRTISWIVRHIVSATASAPLGKKRIRHWCEVLSLTKDLFYRLRLGNLMWPSETDDENPKSGKQASTADPSQSIRRLESAGGCWMCPQVVDGKRLPDKILLVLCRTVGRSNYAGIRRAASRIAVGNRTLPGTPKAAQNSRFCDDARSNRKRMSRSKIPKKHDTNASEQNKDSTEQGLVAM